MKIAVRISNVKTHKYVDVEAIVDIAYSMLTIPPWIADQLDLPEFALVEHDEDHYSLSPLRVSESIGEVVIGLASLASLSFEIDKETGELRSIPLYLLSLAS